MALVYFIIHLFCFFFSFVCVSLIIIISWMRKKKKNRTKNSSCIRHAALFLSLPAVTFASIFFFKLFLYLVYIYNISSFFFFPILTRHAPSFVFSVVEKSSSRKLKQENEKLNNTGLNNTVPKGAVSKRVIISYVQIHSLFHVCHVVNEKKNEEVAKVREKRDAKESGCES